MTVPSDKAIVKNEPKTYVNVPQSLYHVQVADIEYKEGVEGKYGKKDKFYIRLGILDDKKFVAEVDGKKETLSTRGMQLMYFATTVFSQGSKGFSNSKLYDFATAVMNEELDERAGIDVNTLIGGKLQALVKHNKVEDKVYVNVESVMAADESNDLPELTDEELKAILPEGEDVVQKTDVPDAPGSMSDADLDAILEEIGDVDEEDMETN
jgi:hypothetical protein